MITVSVIKGVNLPKTRDWESIKKLRKKYPSSLEHYYNRPRDIPRAAIVRLNKKPISIVAVTEIERKTYWLMSYTAMGYRRKGYCTLATKTLLQSLKIPKNRSVAAYTDRMSGAIEKAGWPSH